MVAILFLVLFCIFHIFIQLTCRKWHDECLFLRLWRSLVREALLLMLESKCIQVFLANGFCACVQCTMSSLTLGLVVLCCHRHRTFWTSSSPWQLPTWDSALTCLLPSLVVFPYFVRTCHTIFLLCYASVLISVALQSVADICYQMQIVLCFPFEMISKNAILLLCCLVAQL